MMQKKSKGSICGFYPALNIINILEISNGSVDYLGFGIQLISVKEIPAHAILDTNSKWKYISNEM